VATGCAIVKLTLIGIAIVYALCGLAAWLWSLRTAGSR
jgi:cbb3-type cytochrome oxidase maturation protein